MSTPRPSQSDEAIAARDLVHRLQQHFAGRLGALAAELGASGAFTPVSWLRDEGRHGGGTRLVAPRGSVFDRGSLNVSSVHYDDLPDRLLASADALSCIVHPAHPRAPSMHMHISWTELRSGKRGWRLMADLNPSLPDPDQTERFRAVLEAASGERYAHAASEGDRYFQVPALGRHRGVAHFYLEGHRTESAAADLSLAEAVGTGVIDLYPRLVAEGARRPLTDADRAAQRAYHTLYLFQVLTLDRGTTSGLLVHDTNDLGIMGSLPSRVDPVLLGSWADRVPAPQDGLVNTLAEIVADGEVDDRAKLALAAAVRAHYRAHPEALALQARGSVVPPTVANHGS